MKKKWKNLMVYTICALVIFLVIRYLFWVVFPFVIAYILMKLFYPPAEWMRKKFKIGRGFSVATLFLAFAGALAGGAWWIIGTLFRQLSGVFANVSIYEAKMNDVVQQCCYHIERLLGLKVEYVKPYLLSQIYQGLKAFGESFSEGIMSYSFVYAKGIIKILGILVIIVVATIVMAKDYERIQEMLKKTNFFPDIKRIKEKTFYAGIVYIRAQLIIMLAISIICVVTFLLMRQNNALLIGALVGILDAFPFFGTGSVLVPWAIIKMFRGDFLRAALYATLYIICSFVREFLEPKLIGKSLGMPAIFIIGSIYMGIVLYGVPGVVLGPVQVLLTMEVGRQWIEDHS